MSDEGTKGLSLTTGVLGALAVASGAWAMFVPGHFFASVAADTGTLNVHLMRDVGAAYVTAGVALSWAAAARGRGRARLVWIAGLFLTLHAAGHVHEIATGALPASHWLEDLPGVFAPALLVLVLAALWGRRERIRTIREGPKTRNTRDTEPRLAAGLAPRSRPRPDAASQRARNRRRP